MSVWLEDGRMAFYMLILSIGLKCVAATTKLYTQFVPLTNKTEVHGKVTDKKYKLGNVLIKA